MDLTILDASARTVFDYLTQNAQALRPHTLLQQHAAPRAVPGTLAEQVEARWDAATVLSLDVFDTAIVRKVRTPKDVFLFLYALPPLDGLGLASRDVAQLRERAEAAARRRAHARANTVEVGLAEIHRELLTMLGATDEAALPALVDAERTAELAVCAPHPFFLELYRRARREGKAVWFVSDTYHSGDFLRHLLQTNGYDDPGDLVFSSCDHRMSKGEGTLFTHLLATRDVAAGEILHVGDNAHADAEVPLRMGVPAVHHPLAATLDAQSLSASAEEALVRGLTAIEERCHEPVKPFWWRFGYTVAGPALAGFALWLHEELRRDGVERAFFLLRDGEILQRVYDVFAEGRPEAVPSSLLYSSRRAFSVPALVAGARSLNAQLFVSANPRPVGEFLRRLDVQVDGLEHAFRGCGFTGPDEIIHLVKTRPEDMERLARLYAHPEVARQLVARSNEERELLLAYLRQERVLGAGRAALVDIGWNGTIQKCLHKAAAHERVQADLVGYYFGTEPGIGARDGEGMRFKSYFFHDGQPRERYTAVFSFRELFELICSSARGSLRRFERRGGRVEPVCERPEVSVQQLDAVRELHDGAVAFAERLRGEMNVFDLTTIPPEVAGAALVRVIVEPTPEEAATVGMMQHGDGMGSATAKHLARFSGDTIDPERILDDYVQAYWRRGLLGQRTAQAMMLRNILWLGQG